MWTPCFPIISPTRFLPLFLWVSAPCHTDKEEPARGSSEMRVLMSQQILSISPFSLAVHGRQSRTVQNRTCFSFYGLCLWRWRRHQAHSTQAEHFPMASLLVSKQYTNWLCNSGLTGLPLVEAAPPSHGCLYNCFHSSGEGLLPELTCSFVPWSNKGKGLSCPPLNSRSIRKTGFLKIKFLEPTPWRFSRTRIGLRHLLVFLTII